VQCFGTNRTFVSALSAMLLFAQVNLPAFAAGSDPILKPFNPQIALVGGTATTNVALTPGALEAANLLGIRSDVERLITMEQSHAGQSLDVVGDEELNLKVRIMDKILGEALEVRTVADRIDRELSWSYTSKGGLEAKRQRTLNYLFTANFMQGGVLGVNAGGQFLHGKPHPGAELLLMASSIGLGLAILAFIEQRRGSKQIDGEETVLVDSLGLNRPEYDFHPPVSMKFLNSVPPGSTDNRTRREVLLDNWKKGKYLRSSDEEQLNKLAAVQPDGTHYKENSFAHQDAI